MRSIKTCRCVKKITFYRRVGRKGLAFTKSQMAALQKETTINVRYTLFFCDKKGIKLM